MVERLCSAAQRLGEGQLPGVLDERQHEVAGGDHRGARAALRGRAVCCRPAGRRRARAAGRSRATLLGRASRRG